MPSGVTEDAQQAMFSFDRQWQLLLALESVCRDATLRAHPLCLILDRLN